MAGPQRSICAAQRSGSEANAALRSSSSLVWGRGVCQPPAARCPSPTPPHPPHTRQSQSFQPLAGDFADGEPQAQVEVPPPEMGNLEELEKVRRCRLSSQEAVVPPGRRSARLGSGRGGPRSSCWPASSPAGRQADGDAWHEAPAGLLPRHPSCCCGPGSGPGAATPARAARPAAGAGQLAAEAAGHLQGATGCSCSSTAAALRWHWRSGPKHQPPPPSLPSACPPSHQLPTCPPACLPALCPRSKRRTWNTYPRCTTCTTS
jgi:hypothetical protein